jgi:hypothetical protein
MLDLASNVYGRVYRGRPAVENVVCDKSKTVLIGEAAYSLTVRFCAHFYNVEISN